VGARAGREGRAGLVRVRKQLGRDGRRSEPKTPRAHLVEDENAAQMRLRGTMTSGGEGPGLPRNEGVPGSSPGVGFVDFQVFRPTREAQRGTPRPVLSREGGIEVLVGVRHQQPFEHLPRPRLA
jgi:hypothetical protein